MISTKLHGKELISVINSIIPKLCNKVYKGQSGRIGVIGGSKEYTGAPYFAAISALKLGADLVHVFCTCDSSPVIKSYSPELIVHPLLDGQNVLESMKPWVDRMHVFVVGPGLGTDNQTLKNVKDIIGYIKSKDLPIVIDADGLWLVIEDALLVKNYKKAILTPNVVEYKRLLKSLIKPPENDSADPIESVKNLSCTLGNVTIVRKGNQDIMSNGEEVVVSELADANPRRCGGQGDVLAGFMATFAYWAHHSSNTQPLFKQLGPSLIAAYAACHLTKECSKESFKEHGRSMITSDIINNIHKVASDIFESY